MAAAPAFGLLKYSTTDNIGDEIQSLAARRFLPHVDYLVDREEMNTFVSPSGPVWTILNGWFCHKPENWPPSEHLSPLIVSLHISPSPSAFTGLRPTRALLAEPAVRYLRGYEPIGARDHVTLRLLRQAGVDAYFSGCLTLTLERPSVEREDDLVVVCDAPTSVADYVRRSTKKRVQIISHAGYSTNEPDERFAVARSALVLYAKASCVITTRLHCALPCTGMGTPVLLLDTAPDPNRFAGLNDFVRHTSQEAFIAGRSGFDIDTPAPNLNVHLPFRQALENRAKEFVDAALTGARQRPYPLSADDRSRANATTLRLASAAKQAKRLATTATPAWDIDSAFGPALQSGQPEPVNSAPFDIRTGIIDFLRQFRNRRVLYFPCPGSASDSLTSTATILLMQRLNIDFELISLEKDVAGEVVLIGGGSNLVPAYASVALALKRFAEKAKAVILMPHTIRGHDETLGCLDRNCFLFCRDPESYTHALNVAPGAHTFLAHDMTFQLDPQELLFTTAKPLYQDFATLRLIGAGVPWSEMRERPVARLFRGDGEATGQHETDADISAIFESGVWPDNAFRSSWALLEFIRTMRAIETDRLRIAVGAWLLGIPCRLYENALGINLPVYRHSMRHSAPTLQFAHTPGQQPELITTAAGA